MLQLSENARQGEPTQEQFSISELSREFDVTTRAIRFYEDEGLLEPHRQGRQRVYSSRDRIRLKLILRGKRLGFSLSEIGDIIDMYDSEPGEVGQLGYFIEKISLRRKTLKQQRDDIDVTLKELDNIEKQCRQSMAHLD
ncbi:MAG TPA: MerR family DNA-binding transcriptional regulator [Gammaproteobacteria bacterium]|jgi:DNA-binding transcriptional MerR regulator|nr:MerR family DNA-binding transcriptional regulator [Gammaproteobacteria bacterium]PHS05243.1 MAG: MerR family transcriptional regulator [Acidithiobacillus sp.]HAD38478.1 MerR family transcriptional regulator [Gammaproteobacteria bacterium]HBK74956.1 MerR family transcriptional regulator [Gammaproteobacteria bacterium]HHZ73177.1 MerR family DNA-binding transcriptional regulator [Gammaproteobacteria bacterium]